MQNQETYSSHENREYNFEGETLPSSYRIERISKSKLDLLENIQNLNVSDEHIQIDEEISELISLVSDYTQDKKQEEVIKFLLPGLLDAVNEVNKIIEDVTFYKKSLDNIREIIEEYKERGITIEESIKSFNELYDKFKVYEGSDRDINNYDEIRNGYEKLIKDLKSLEISYENISLFKDCINLLSESYHDNLQKIRETFKLLIESNPDDAFSVLDIEKGVWPNGEYSSIAGNWKINPDQPTIPYKFIAFFSILNGMDDVKDVEVLRTNSNDTYNKNSDEEILMKELYLDNSTCKEYRGIKFKYKEKEYVAFISNSYGNATYIVPKIKLEKILSEGAKLDKAKMYICNRGKNGSNTNRIFWRIKESELDNLKAKISDINRLSNNESPSDQLNKILGNYQIISEIAEIFRPILEDKLVFLDKLSNELI